MAILVAGLLAWSAAAGAAAPKSCHAKGATYRRGPIRVYLRGSRQRTYYLCSQYIRAPRAYHVRTIDPAEDVPFDYTVRRRRLVYDDFDVKTQADVLAWVDLRTGEYRQAPVPGQPNTYTRMRAVTSSGGIAFVTYLFDKDERIWYAAPAAGELARPRILVRLVDGDMRDGSLRVSAARVRWTSFTGARQSAPLAGPPRPVRLPLSCDTGRRVYGTGPNRILFRLVGNTSRLYVCSSRLRKPKQFLDVNTFGGQPLGEFRRFGPRLLFTADWGGDEGSLGIGWVDLRTGKESDVAPDFSTFDEDVLGSDGGLAVRSEKKIYYAPSGPKGLGRLRPIATVAGEPAKKSLSVHDGQVWWMTADGQSASAPTS